MDEDHPSVATLRGDGDSMRDLWNWACTVGGSGPKVKLSRTAARTVVTSTNIHGTLKEGDPILSVPIPCLMHPAAATVDPQYGSTLSALSLEDGVDDRTLLVFFLAFERERGAASRWAPYINLLPVEVPSPVGWSNPELLSLTGTRLEGAVKFQREALRQQTEVWVPKLLVRLREQLEHLNSSAAAPGRAAAAEVLALAETALTPGRIAWSRSCVWSRAFSLYLSGTKTTAMVPLGDMLDHSPLALVEWRTDDTAGTFSILSHEPIRVGAAVYNNYGAKSNEELLLGYGFVLEPNQADTLHLRLAVNDMDFKNEAGEARIKVEEPAAREALLRRCGLDKVFFLRRDDPLPDALLGAARVYLMSPATAYSCECGTEGLWRTQNAMEVSNDLCTSFRALQALTRLLTSDLERLSSGLDSVVDSCYRDGAVRGFVSKMSTVYRGSQHAIATSALEALTNRSRRLILKLGETERARLAANNVGLLATNLMTEYNEELQKAYHAWEAEVGVEKAAAEELSMFEGWIVLGAGAGGLCVTAPVAEGELLGSVPAEALLVATATALESSQAIAHTSDKAALAATLLLYAEEVASITWGPFARWLLSAPTTAAAFPEDVLAMLEATSLGHEAIGAQRAYDDEFSELMAAGVLSHWINNPSKSATYARARAVVERHSFRLPCHAQSAVLPATERLALAPFVGSLPRSLDDVAGVLCWSRRPTGATNVGCCSSGWRLDLRARCRLGAGALLVAPLEGSDEANRLLEVGSGAASPRGKTYTASSPYCGDVLIANQWSVVEMLLEPADNDNELRRRKKMLLRAAGLGEAHYLTLPPAPARLCAALAVCGAENDAVLQVIEAAISEVLVPHAAPATFVIANDCSHAPSGGSIGRIYAPESLDHGSWVADTLEPWSQACRHNDSRILREADGVAPAASTCFALKAMSEYGGMCERAGKAARTLLRRMLGLLPKDADKELLWVKAREANTQVDYQRAGAFGYIAQHRVIIKSWLEALTPPPIMLRGRKKRRWELV